MIDEDIELYSLFRKGDRKAFDTLFLKYYSILCAFGKYYIPIEDAEEVVLDIMTWLWENREFQIIETSLRSYLFMAVRNRCLDLISKNQTKRRCYEGSARPRRRFRRLSRRIHTRPAGGG